MGMTAEVGLHFEPKRHDKIKDNRRAERQKGRIDKVKPDAAGGDIHLLAQPTADPERLLFHEVSDFIHTHYT